MAQSLTQAQTQEQKLTQQLKLTQQQLLAVRLIEMPIDKLKQDMLDEIYNNPALEQESDDDTHDYEPLSSGNDNDDDTHGNNNYGNDNDEQLEAQDKADMEREMEASAKEEHDSEVEKSLERLDNEDEPYDNTQDNYAGIEYKEVENRNQQSFLDTLNEQMGELDLTPDERIIMEQLIGSLENDGLLKTPLDTIMEHLYCYYNMDVKEEDIERTLRKLQTFDPAGVGARNLKECMLLQIERMEEGTVKEMLITIITDHYEEFSKNHWDKIKRQLNISDQQIATLRKTIRHRLTPRPGAALGETVGVSLSQITPDFIVEITDDNRVTVEINDSRLPKLHISNEFEVMLDSYKTVSDKQLNRNDLEAKKYLGSCLDKGNMYIEAIKTRRDTLQKTMNAIIKWQRKYFIEGDDTELRPMRLEDIAKETGLDISTISRATRDKYVQSQWDILPLKFFFSTGYVTGEGDEIATKKIKQALKEIVDAENKRKPLSDEALVDIMQKKGFPIARRTIAKYRNQMGIPESRLRKM